MSETMNVSVFVHPSLGSVRTVLINQDPWFVGKDVAAVLGYKDTVNALKAHVDEEDKMGWRITTPSRGMQTVTVINESGVYSLIFSSKLPSAREFTHWVTSEVLPAIRRTGMYNSQRALAQAQDEARDMRDQNESMALTIAQLQDGVEAYKEKTWSLRQELATKEGELFSVKMKAKASEEKAAYADKVLSGKSLVPVGVIAAEYGMTAARLNKWLLANEVIYKRGNRWYIASAHRDKGWIGYKTLFVDGSEEPRVTMSWTQKGRMAIHAMLDAAGFRMTGTGEV